MSKRKIEVMFRWEPKFLGLPGYVVATFPYEPAFIRDDYERDSDVCVIFYSDVKEFSWTRFEASMGRKPARPDQYVECLKELEALGFEVEIITKVDKKRLKESLKDKPIFALPDGKTWGRKALIGEL